MAFVSRFNPKTGVADFWSEFRKPNPYRWPMLAVSVLPILVIVYWAASEEVYKNPERPKITYISTFDPDRTDAEITASNEANQEISDLRKAEAERVARQKRDAYKALGAATGMDVDRIEAEADAERAAEEAAKQERLERSFGSNTADNSANTPLPEDPTQ